MVTIIHGDNHVASRNYLLQHLNDKQKVVFNGKTVTLTDLIQAVEGGELFDYKEEIVIEELFFKKKSEVLKKLILFLKDKDDINLTIWEPTELSSKDLGLFKKVNIKAFRLPKNIFLFLDSIGSHNTNAVRLFHEAQDTQDVEIIFYMLVRQFRLLLALSEPGDKTQIDEVGRLAPWQRSKLQRQAAKFSKDALKKIYKNIYEIDINHKIGVLPYSLSQAIDFLLLDI